MSSVAPAWEIPRSNGGLLMAAGSASRTPASVLLILQTVRVVQLLLRGSDFFICEKATHTWHVHYFAHVVVATCMYDIAHCRYCSAPDWDRSGVCSLPHSL